MTEQLFIRVPLQEHTALMRQLTAVLAENVRLASRTDGDGDEHHTLDELYEYRMLYNALVFNEWERHGTYPVVKSMQHSNGEDCFGGGWFIVVAELPTGQISNHYRIEHWDLFQVRSVALPPEYDGHTPADAARRMLALLSQPTPTTDHHVCTGPHEDGRDEACTCGLGCDHDHQEHDARRADEAEFWKPAVPPSIADMVPGQHAYVDDRFGDDGICHAPTDGGYPHHCYRPRTDRVHAAPAAATPEEQ
jgi:hypothetical protein